MFKTDKKGSKEIMKIGKELAISRIKKKNYIIAITIFEKRTSWWYQSLFRILSSPISLSPSLIIKIVQFDVYNMLNCKYRVFTELRPKVNTFLW